MKEIGGEQSLGINASEKGLKINQGLTIEYDSKLEQEDVPYFVKLDKEKCEGLLKEAGLSPETVGRTRILLTRTPKDNTRIFAIGASRPFGSFCFEKGENVVKIYTDAVWSSYVEALRTVSKIIGGEKVNGRESKFLKKLLRTKKLEAYLGYAPPERGLKFASKLLLNAINIQEISAISHEIKHASENIPLMKAYEVAFSSGGKISAGAFGWLVAREVSSIGGVFTSLPVEVGIALVAGAYLYFGSFNPIFYLLRPHEIKARSFAKKQENNPKWKNLISITPKHPLVIGEGSQVF